MRARAEGGLGVKVMGLKLSFVLATVIPLAIVMAVTAAILNSKAASIVSSAQTDLVSEAVRFTHVQPDYELEPLGVGLPNGVSVFRFKSESTEGVLYRHERPGPNGLPERLDLLVPETGQATVEMLRVIIGSFLAVVVIGIALSVWVADTVVKPVEGLMYDVRQIAMGNLRHRTKAKGPAELRLLARAIDRMSSDLAAGRETELELSVREREVELATGVRDALLPHGTPLIEGYDLGAAFLASPRFGGDFHDFVQRADGKWGMLVCDVSGRGLPAALVGAIARAYLRVELERPGEVADAFRRVNRWLAGDVRRGMFVTALYALLEPAEGRVTVACAGHKIPLLRVCAADGQVRVVQPEGIALGLDKGAVFERRLQVVEVPLEPGDRIVLTNSAPVRIADPSGAELGEKNFYARVKKHATADTTQFLRALRRDLEQYAGDPGFQEDLSIVTVARNKA
jgi:serine phosphatase RsbU (regulator of sigma subunit)